ncbi:MAG: hypothetical protein JSV80_10320 [Acidobacteriota bacterium]|nr:MAG: hypothetical protein JSV80_10320 [Acidobacteriota bacterium]
MKAGCLAVCCLVALTAACWLDAAERHYFAALEGEEEGSTRQQQIAHLDRAIERARCAPCLDPFRDRSALACLAEPEQVGSTR